MRRLFAKKQFATSAYFNDPSSWGSYRRYAPLKNKNQIPSVDAWVQDQQRVRIPQGEFEVIELPGHTLGIVGYLNRKSKCLFAGDVLFGLGCGRLFEGSPEVAFNSLAKIAGLEPSTSVYCTHEYTLSNLQFVESLRAQKKLPEHFDFQFFETYKARTLKMRAASLPTVPLSLKAELKVNPFLLCVVAKDLALFTKLRDERNYFRPK